ncbi:MAG: hypothetical protein GKR90_14210 [Pseudomonadales bacterium]|nr:hypothetical protein [Pseudomonadales bacterium]
MGINKWAVVSVVLLGAISIFAAELSIPNSFTQGETILSAQVNENFESLASESNAQDARIASTEAAIAALQILEVEDQLICVFHYGWVLDGTQMECVTRNEPSSKRYRTYAQIASEGWIAQSVGGADPRMIMIFSK